MRTIAGTITKIQALLPTPETTPVDVRDQMTILRAELNVIEKRTLYMAPESASTAWEDLSGILYRLMPRMGSYPWVKAVSDEMLNGT